MSTRTNLMIHEDKTSNAMYRKHMMKYTDNDSVKDIFDAVIKCSDNQTDGHILIAHEDFFNRSVDNEVKIDIDDSIHFTSFVDARNDKALYKNINDKFAEKNDPIILIKYDFINLDEMFEKMIRLAHAKRMKDNK